MRKQSWERSMNQYPEERSRGTGNHVSRGRQHLLGVGLDPGVYSRIWARGICSEGRYLSSLEVKFWLKRHWQGKSHSYLEGAFGYLSVNCFWRVDFPPAFHSWDSNPDSHSLCMLLPPLFFGGIVSSSCFHTLNLSSCFNLLYSGFYPLCPAQTTVVKSTYLHIANYSNISLSSSYLTLTSQWHWLSPYSFTLQVLSIYPSDISLLIFLTTLTGPS